MFLRPAHQTFRFENKSVPWAQAAGRSATEDELRVGAEHADEAGVDVECIRLAHAIYTEGDACEAEMAADGYFCETIIKFQAFWQ